MIAATSELGRVEDMMLVRIMGGNFAVTYILNFVARRTTSVIG